MSAATDLEARLAQFVEAHVLRGETLDVHVLCEGRPDLVGPLDQLIREYRALTTELDADGVDTLNEPLVADSAGPAAAGLPQFPGFQTIERIGGGGMGDVFKLRDVQLNRIVAAKVMRRDPAVATGLAEFLREARALALFSDRRIVQIFEARVDANPPVLIMEYVEGFELGRIGPSLEFAQRARIVLEVCHALAHAHGLGLQHRDLKPSNIMVDAQLAPRILDFGLSAGDPRTGHLKGTVRYLAPEQLDP